MNAINVNTMSKKIIQILSALLLMAVAATGQASVESTTYILTDHLGSPILATDENGDVKWREDYQPFGTQIINEDGNNAAGFTGHLDDKTLNVTYMQGRWYHPEMGRFMAIDPVGFVEEHPATFNRYSYGNNNPYKFVDPNGESAVTAFGGLLVESSNFAKGDGFNGDAVWGALKDGYDGEGDGFASAAFEDVTSFVPVGAIIGTASKITKLAKLSKVTKRAEKLCFVKGTLVHTQDGLKPIEEIQVGDLVKSKAELTGETTWKPVTELFRNHDKAILNITLVGNDGKEKSLGATKEHPFWVEGRGWVNAGELQEGYEISSVNSNVLTVKSIVPDVQLHDTYNFEVADYHTYFVGEQGAWVHNQCRGLWQTTKEGTERVVQHGKFGKIFKSKSDGLWWSKDTAGHGGSQWKVFRETKNGLEWYKDADKYGDFIVGKHKGDVGKFIPWKELKGTNF